MRWTVLGLLLSHSDLAVVVLELESPRDRLLKFCQSR